jgi:glycosyltransferase involved in cell wall biosynthesis
MSKTLYLCYFGVREPLVQTQVLPYLREIKKDVAEVSLLTFEPSLDGTWEAEMEKKLAAEGIDWHCLRYHKRFSIAATAYDIFRGVIYVRRLIHTGNFDVLHGRVHIPTLMGALARKLSRQKPKLLFDIRGFFPEEYVDAGLWKAQGLTYRAAKGVERWLLKVSDGFVVLTEKAREILFPESRETGLDKLGRPVEVIPCCVDLERFSTINGDERRSMRRELGIENRNVIAYVGSFGGWYLTEEMLDFFSVAREQDPETFVMVLTQREHEKVVKKLKDRGFTGSDLYVRSVEPSELPRHLAAADIALSFIKACYSKQSSSPTKIAEYLACGLPIIANKGVGDIDDLISRFAVGAVVEDFDRPGYIKAIEQIRDGNHRGTLCRKVAKEHFDLTEVGGNLYRRLYSRIMEDQYKKR